MTKAVYKAMMNLEKARGKEEVARVAADEAFMVLIEALEDEGRD